MALTEHVKGMVKQPLLPLQMPWSARRSAVTWTVAVESHLQLTAASFGRTGFRRLCRKLVHFAYVSVVAEAKVANIHSKTNQPV
mmetsp:Transcript_64820/g.103128  ORF Transcript_64820/g.103128 Transcript_64820/m.103128 type:complete len:84 (+) Transcript_64820:667-918(+)